MSDCRFGVSPVNYPDPDPDHIDMTIDVDWDIKPQTKQTKLKHLIWIAE